jgi:hypothetical protein
MSHYRLYYLDDITLAGEGRRDDEEQRQWKRQNSTGEEELYTHSIPVNRSEEEEKAEREVPRRKHASGEARRPRRMEDSADTAAWLDDRLRTGDLR